MDPTEPKDSDKPASAYAKHGKPAPAPLDNSKQIPSADADDEPRTLAFRKYDAKPAPSPDVTEPSVPAESPMVDLFPPAPLEPVVPFSTSVSQTPAGDADEPQTLALRKRKQSVAESGPPADTDEPRTLALHKRGLSVASAPATAENILTSSAQLESARCSSKTSSSSFQALLSDPPTTGNEDEPRTMALRTHRPSVDKIKISPPAVAPKIEQVPEPTAEPVAAPPQVKPACTEPAAICPKCGAQLLNPRSLGLCPACGYCRSLQNETVSALLERTEEPSAPSLFGLVDFFRLLQKLPHYVEKQFSEGVFFLLALIVGCGSVLALSFVVESVLPAGGPERAAWSALQLIAGITLFIAAQIAAMALVGVKDERMGTVDMVVPFRLWLAALRQLPETRWSILLASWGMTIVLCAIFVIGGLAYWPTTIRAAVADVKWPSLLRSQPAEEPTAAPE